MPSFTKSLSTFALALAASASLASARVAKEQTTKNGLTYTKGIYHPGPKGVSKRDQPPHECAFGDRQTYSYLAIDGLDEPACIGWASPVDCGEGPWGEPDRGDIEKAMAELVTKDGQFESGESGDWFAAFQTFTTAFGNRDTQPFNDALDKMDTHAITVYWSRGGDYAEVNKDSC